MEVTVGLILVVTIIVGVVITSCVEDYLKHKTDISTAAVNANRDIILSEQETKRMMLFQDALLGRKG